MNMLLNLLLLNSVTNTKNKPIVINPKVRKVFNWILNFISATITFLIFGFLLSLLILSAYPMKCVIVDGKVFATHSDNQIITNLHYPKATGFITCPDGINPLGSPEVRDNLTGKIITKAIPPMTEAQIRKVMKGYKVGVPLKEIK